MAIPSPHLSALPLAHTSPTLPLELVDRIAHKILLPHDLCPLAAANSTFHAIIYSFHLRCREISCCIDDGSMWDWLEENPRRLRGVRFLHLRYLPQTFRNPPSTYGESPLNKRLLPPLLISQMDGLVSFDWDMYTPLTLVGLGRREISRYQNEIWSRLALLSCLEGVTANGEFPCDGCARREGSDVSTVRRQQVTRVNSY